MRKTTAEIIQETFYEISDKYLPFLTATIVSLAFLLASFLFLPPFGFFISIGVYGCLMVGMAGFGIKTLDEKKAKIEDIAKEFKNILNLFIAEVVKIFFIAFWGIFLIVPGIYKCLEYSQMHFILSEKRNIGVFEALAESKKLTHNHKGKILLLYLTLILMTVILTLFSGSVVIITKLFVPISQTGSLVWFGLMTLILVVFVVCPFAHISKTLLYETLKEENKKGKTNPKPSTLSEVAQEIVKAFKPSKKEKKEMKQEMKEMKNNIEKKAKQTGDKIKKTTRKAADNVKKGATDFAKKTKKAAKGTKKAVEDAFEK